MFTLPEVIVHLRPGAKWKMTDIHDYETLQWKDDTQTQPSLEECHTMKVQLEKEQMLKNMRTHRDGLLDKTDKYATIDYPHPTPEAKQAWLDYRQALRDLPTLITLDGDGNMKSWVTNQGVDTLSSRTGLIISDLSGYFTKGEKAVLKISENCDFTNFDEENNPREIRYLDASGAQTDEANAIHIAAFVRVFYNSV